MGISKVLKNKFEHFSEEDRSRLVRLGWEDRSTFEVIQVQFHLSPNEFVLFMRTTLPRAAFDRWRRRISARGRLKNEKKRGFKSTRFKCSRQSVDGITKGWK
ncbi:MAG: TIGR03643 family protein [Bdellovibrio sp.]|nr:TIGR03643 family protein [Bdellovibrio sp.]